MIRKLAAIGGTALACGAFLALPVITTLAHTPNHQVSCDGITASGVKYTEGGSVDLTVGSVHSHRTFVGPTFTFSVANPDKAKPEAWSIVIDSNAGTDGDASYSGTIPACEVPPTTTVPAPTTTAPAVTTTTSAPTTTVVASTTTAPAPPETPTTTAVVPPPFGEPAPSTDVGTPPVPVHYCVTTTGVRITVADDKNCSAAVMCIAAGRTWNEDHCVAPPSLPQTGAETSMELRAGLGILIAGVIAWLVLPRVRRRRA